MSIHNGNFAFNKASDLFFHPENFAVADLEIFFLLF